MPNRKNRENLAPCPVLELQDNPRTRHDQDKLQHLVRRVHTRHPITHASADIRDKAWRLSVVSAATGRLVMAPASLMIRSTPDGATLLPPCSHHGRDIVAEFAQAMDAAARYVTHPTTPDMQATLLQMAVLRSACVHEQFSQLIAQPFATPHVEWRDDQWRLDDEPIEGTFRPGDGQSIEYSRLVGWDVRRGARDWEFDRKHIHILGATLPESVIPACGGRAFDDVFDVPALRGAGLVVRAVRNGRRAGVPAVRVTVAARRLDDMAQALDMSRAMDAAREVRKAA